MKVIKIGFFATCACTSLSALVTRPRAANCMHFMNDMCVITKYSSRHNIFNPLPYYLSFHCCITIKLYGGNACIVGDEPYYYMLQMLVNVMSVIAITH